jgi:hypothetical protein
LPLKANADRRHRSPKQRHRSTNSAAYDATLRQHGRRVAITWPSGYGFRVFRSAPYSYIVGIDPADFDFMGHVNNASYLKWVQAAVISHWQQIAPADAVAGYLWVALKHEIT